MTEGVRASESSEVIAPSSPECQLALADLIPKGWPSRRLKSAWSLPTAQPGNPATLAPQIKAH